MSDGESGIDSLFRQLREIGIVAALGVAVWGVWSWATTEAWEIEFKQTINRKYCAEIKSKPPIGQYPAVLSASVSAFGDMLELMTKHTAPNKPFSEQPTANAYDMEKIVNVVASVCDAKL